MNINFLHTVIVLNLKNWILIIPKLDQGGNLLSKTWKILGTDLSSLIPEDSNKQDIQKWNSKVIKIQNHQFGKHSKLPDFKTLASRISVATTAVISEKPLKTPRWFLKGLWPRHPVWQLYRPKRLRLRIWTLHNPHDNLFNLLTVFFVDTSNELEAWVKPETCTQTNIIWNRKRKRRWRKMML